MAYKARYERGESGWVVRVSSEDVSAFGRTLEKARFAIVARLAKHLAEYRGKIVVTDDIELTAKAARSLEKARAARAAALAAAAESQSATRDAARQLVRAGLSYRDAAYLLGLSHSRVQQLTGGE